MVAGAFPPKVVAATHEQPSSKESSFKIRHASGFSLKIPGETPVPPAGDDDDIATSVLRSSYDDLRDVREAIRILLEEEHSPWASEQGVTLRGEDSLEPLTFTVKEEAERIYKRRSNQHVPVISPYIEDLELPPAEYHDNLLLPDSAQAEKVLEAVLEDKQRAFLSDKARDKLAQHLQGVLLQQGYKPPVGLMMEERKMCVHLGKAF
eukprot:1193710-Prorocentrum_minimum.AAC.2